MKIFKRIISIFFVFMLFGCSKEYNYKIEKIDNKDVYVINNNKYVESSSETNYIKIDVNGYGIIIAELYPDVAPETVKNFKKLVSKKFYDDLIFHRVINDFMIQTGDSNESKKTIKGEFLANGYDNKLIHSRGVLSMARRGGNPDTSETMNSASSQFFIVQKTNSSLDGNYASFGEVIDGIEIVDKIAACPTDENDKPINNQIINSIRFVDLYENNKNYTLEEKDEKISYKIEGKTFTESAKETNLVKIEVRNYGIMIAELYPSIAPETVKNFKKLVSEEYYDYMIFHRVIKDFMIQTGDPLGSGQGGSKKTIKGEFKDNGFDNKLSHTRGVLSMARRGAFPDTSETMNSASSQFFIVHKDNPSLDGKYASFGKVLYGYDVLDLVANISTDEYDMPLDVQRLYNIRFVKEGE